MTRFYGSLTTSLLLALGSFSDIKDIITPNHNFPQLSLFFIINPLSRAAQQEILIRVEAEEAATVLLAPFELDYYGLADEAA